VTPPSAWPLLEDRRPGPGRLAGFVGLLLTVASGLAVFSAFPWAASPPGAAVLKVAFKHVAARADAAAVLSREELEKLPRHMRPQGGEGVGTGPRRDTVLRVMLDGRPLLDRSYRPSGLRHDGPTFVYEELPLSPGRYRLEATLAESSRPPARGGAAPAVERRITADVEVRPEQVLLLELSTERELIVR
jgi:hypothetical protein